MRLPQEQYFLVDNDQENGTIQKEPTFWTVPFFAESYDGFSQIKNVPLSFLRYEQNN